MTTPTRSGFSAVQFNFRERIVSDDQNRAHQLTAQAVAEMLRRAHLSSASSATAGGKTVVESAVATPLRALIFEGIRFRPEIGTVNAFVEPGSLVAASPESDPHPADSPARLITDAGVQTAGQLTLTTGPAATRVDVVECQPLQQVVETDSRDIFDPSTGLFAPASVNKVVRTGLSYRIRTGTDGGGFPGLALGWLPIAVCSVPSGAATWNDATVWDVRPLLADLASPPGIVAQDFGRIVAPNMSAIDQGAGVWAARGICAAEVEGFKVGGELASSSSGASFLDLNAAGGLQEPGFAAVASRPWLLYLLTPFGLPRWCRLNPSSTGNRDPGSLRGIPVFTQTGPNLTGRPSAVVAIPAATGLGGSTTSGASVLSGAFAAGPTFRSSTVSAGWTQLADSAISVSPTAGAGTSAVTYRLVDNATHPGNASAVRVRFRSSIADAAGTTYGFQRVATVKDGIGGNVIYVRRAGATQTVPTAAVFTDNYELDLELPPNLPSGAGRTIELTFELNLSGGAPVFSTQSMLMIGWRLG